VLRVGVHRDRTSQLRADELGHQRHPGGAAHQQDGGKILRLDVGRAQGAFECLDRVIQRRPDHRFQFGAGQSHLSGVVGQQYRDGGVSVGRERFLGFGALRTQPSHRRDGGGIILVELAEGVTYSAGDVGEDRGVDIDPPSRSMPSG
jgi:hypothetical protein